MNPPALFLEPEALPLLLLAPLVWVVLRVLDRRRVRRLASLAGPRLAAAPETRPRGRAGRRALLAGGLLLALSATLHPVFGAEGRAGAWRGVDLVLCLDVSRSMLAQDLAPDRLTRARQEIRALAERVRGERLALVAFAGEARMVAPLTKDADSVAALADLADPGSVARGGTDLGAALDAALRLLGDSAGETAAIVLLTDGEDHEERGLEAARRCRARGVTVHALGLGTALGGKIAREEGGGFLRDARGAEVLTRLDAAGLARIAEATGGTFAKVPGASLVALYEEQILPRARASSQAGGGRDREDRFQWPLLAAFLLWLLDLALTERTRR